MTVATWYRDPISCLQSTVATLLLESGHDPLVVLGAGWGFTQVPGQTTTEEFSFADRYGDLGRALAPHHHLTMTWHCADASAGAQPLRDALAATTLPIIAVDNFHLPFRPAYHDVHAAHLIVVSAIDLDRSTACVSDAMPPAYQGEIALDDLLASWGSANPPDTQDDFFSDAPIGRRWLCVGTGDVDSSLDGDRLAAMLVANVRAMRDGSAGPVRTGLRGLAAWSADVVGAAAAGVSPAVAQVYVLGWGLQAQAALHGELLRRQGVRWRMPELREAGRAVERVAHLWTGVRVTAAHGRLDPSGAAADLARHTGRLSSGYLAALDSIDEAVRALSS